MNRKVFIKIIKIYQKYISPYSNRHCKFYPSCSEYAKLAFEKYGVFKGLIFSCRRILKCHPFSKGGVDMP
ncbi:membrane protein insertion efficiency factor YidD [bacterium]|nr:membrane protein insertion efficiency factor YidD [bacterium]